MPPPPPPPPSPLKLDPARLATTRRVLAALVRRRFALLRRSLRALLAEDPFAPGAGRWRFVDDAGKLDAFRAWLDAEVERVILSGDWARHLQAAWVKGADRAFDDARRPALARDRTGTIGGERREYHRRLMRGGQAMPALAPRTRTVQGAFEILNSRGQVQALTYPFAIPVVNAPRHSLRDLWGRSVSQKMLTLAARLKSELKGAADAMAQRSARAVMDGLTRRQTKAELTAAVTQAVGAGERRALLIAASELQRAYAEGQLDGLEELDVDAVGLTVEWETTSGSPCRRCSEREGRTYALAEARGLIPFHPNCMCVWRIA